MNLDELKSACTIDKRINQASIDFPAVIGIDEVGRGSLFGHMTVCGVMMPADLTGYFDELSLPDGLLPFLNDSKKLTEKRREKLYGIIDELCLQRVLVDVPVSAIDRLNIRQATLLGMKIAIETLAQAVPNAIVLIDGDACPKLDLPCHCQTVIQGDGKHSTIACASILAKVSRDRQMQQYAERYPQYGIEKHKGYGTAHHRNAILTHGILPEHRKSFSPMKEMLGKRSF